MRLVEVEDAMGPLGWVPVPDPEPPAADPALDLAIAAEQARLANPRNPRHFGTIEGGRNSVSGGRTTRDTQSVKNTVRTT